MFRPNWSSSGVQVVEEISAPLSHQLVAHTHITSYIKTEPTTRNIQNSYIQHQRKANTNKSNITITVIEQQYIT
jgi:hypothetical protein